MKTILCFGEALIDLLNTGQESDGPLQLSKFRQYPGGAPANVAVAIAKLGGKTKFIGQVGADSFGDFLIDALNKYGVDTSLTYSTHEAKTALAFVLLDDKGERSFCFYRDKTADLIFKKEQIKKCWFNKNTLFHFCSNTLTDDDITATTEYAVKCAENNNATISFDVNLRHNLWHQQKANQERVNHLAKQANILKFSRDEFDFLSDGQKKYIDTLLSNKTQLILITNGGKPVRYYSQNKTGEIVVPSVDAIDTTAAGDAFIGSFLFGLSQVKSLGALLQQQSSLEALLTFSVQCGTFAVGQQGAFTSLPSFNDVKDYFPFNEIKDD